MSDSTSDSPRPVSRRDFVAGTAKAAFGAMIVPRYVLGGRGFQAPSDTANLAFVGVGGMGFSNMVPLLSQNVAAVCDVDMGFVERSLAGRLRPNREGVVSQDSLGLRDAYVKAKKYTDFRKMLEAERGIDGIVVATPDHVHAPIAAMAMKMGKHVYVQKPLTYSVHEARALRKIAADNPKVVTQMGNQGHSGEGTRRINELIASGIIGPVREVHVWTDRPVTYWAQGIPRPANATAALAAGNGAQPAGAPQTPPPQPVWQGTHPQPNPLHPRWSMRSVDQAVLAAMAANPQTPPPGLDWDLWLGPVAKPIPYHPAYHPFSWRGWVDFGVGAIGDMGAHLLDQPYWALDLDYPTAITTSFSPWGGGRNDPATYPLATTVAFEFAARGQRGPVNLYWYDGGIMPPRPAMLPDTEPLSRADGGGGIFIGEKGILTYEVYGNNPRVWPAPLGAEAERVPKSFPRVEEAHEMDWVKAMKGERKASAPFEYAAPLTELMLLGIVALRAGPGRKIHYDAARMAFPDAPEVTPFLTREYRSGWSL